MNRGAKDKSFALLHDSMPIPEIGVFFENDDNKSIIEKGVIIS